MKQALISPEEKVYSYTGAFLGERVAETITTPFEVAPPLFWVACNDDVVAAVPPKPTLEELQAQLAALSAQIAALAGATP